jgi:hypothetical protein
MVRDSPASEITQNRHQGRKIGKLGFSKRCPSSDSGPEKHVGRLWGASSGLAREPAASHRAALLWRPLR